MLKLNLTTQFKRDLKLCKKRGYNITLLNAIVNTLRIPAALSPKNAWSVGIKCPCSSRLLTCLILNRPAQFWARISNKTLFSDFKSGKLLHHDNIICLTGEPGDVLSPNPRPNGRWWVLWLHMRNLWYFWLWDFWSLQFWIWKIKNSRPVLWRELRLFFNLKLFRRVGWLALTFRLLC